MKRRMVEVEWMENETGRKGTFIAPATESTAISLKKNGISSNVSFRRVRKFSIEVESSIEAEQSK